MSQENVEIIRRGIDAWNRNDLEAHMADYHPEVIGMPPEGWPDEGETIRGRDALRRTYQRLKDSWEEERLETDDFLPLGDRVLYLGRWIGRGKDSGGGGRHP
jgi:ketosteroid isomerase-like protein